MSPSIAELIHLVCVQWQLKPEPIALLVILIKRMRRLCLSSCVAVLDVTSWLLLIVSGPWISSVGAAHRSVSVVPQRWHCHHLLGFIYVCGDNNELALEQGGQETWAALNFIFSSWAAFGFRIFNPQLPPMKAMAFWESFSDQPCSSGSSWKQPAWGKSQP